MLGVIAWLCLIAIIVIAVVIYSQELQKRKMVKNFGEQECEVKTLANGEVVIKTVNELYFHAVDAASIPVMVSKEEGERLWSLED